MANSVKEISCTHCIHRQVCTYKDDFHAVNKANVSAQQKMVKCQANE